MILKDTSITYDCPYCERKMKAFVGDIVDGKEAILVCKVCEKGVKIWITVKTTT